MGQPISYRLTYNKLENSNTETASTSSGDFACTDIRQLMYEEKVARKAETEKRKKAKEAKSPRC